MQNSPIVNPPGGAESGCRGPLTRARKLLLLLPVALILALVGANVWPPSASAAINGNTFQQCNNIAGTDFRRCDVAIVNTLTIDANGALLSDTTTQTVGTCTGTLAIPCTPAQATTTVAGPITAVTQCNGSENAGGGGVKCSATITNNITSLAAISPAAATVNECVGSGGGGGTVTFTCNPFPATTSGATITQCNGSGSGGGNTVTCSVAGNPRLPEASSRAEERPSTMAGRVGNCATSTR